MVYNAILRRWPEELYRRFANQNNLYSTTIAVLVRQRARPRRGSNASGRA